MATMKYILRTPKAWRVRVRVGGEMLLDRQFNFIKLDGVNRSKLLAIEARDRIMTLHGLHFRRTFQAFKPAGICIGVVRSKNIQHGKTFHSWTAHIQHKGKMKRQSFSINLYGEATAFYFACEARYQGVGELIVVRPKALLCQLDFPYKVRLPR